MNSYQRVMAVINNTIPDQTPNLNIMMTKIAKDISVNYKEFCLSSKLLVEGNLYCTEKYNLDAVTIMKCPIAEFHDLGGETGFPDDDVPYPIVPLIKNKQDLLKLKLVNPLNGKMMAINIDAIESYAKQIKGEIPIIGWVEGCFAESADLMGVSEFLITLADDEDDFIPDLLEFVLQQQLLYAKAQIDAGADIIGVGDAISSVAGPSMYEEYAGEYQFKLLSGIKEMGGKTKLHICGNTTPFLDKLPYDVIDILDVDWMVDIKKAKIASQERCVLSGNYDPVACLLQNTPNDVDRVVRKALDGQSLSRYISSAGCEVPKFTPDENLLQVSSTLKQLALK